MIKEEGELKVRSKTRLITDMRKAVTKMMEQSLDYAHVACPSDNFLQLRAKILRVGNDCMRFLEREFRHYDVVYTKTVEEVIEFKR